MGALVVVAGIMFIIGVVVTLTNIKNFQRRKRIIATPTSPIAQAPGNAIVEVKGRIVPSEQGFVETPFSGRHAVWCRVTVQELRQSGRSSHWHTIVSEADGRQFMIDDGSGQMARVLPQAAEVVLEKQSVGSSGTFKDAAPHLVSFLAARGVSTTSWLGFNKSMRYEEEILGPGDAIYALGPSRRDPGPPMNDGYRVVPTSLLVMFSAGRNLAGELLLTNKTEEQLTSKLMTGFVIGLVLTGLSVVIGLVGGIGAFVGD